MKVAAGAIYEIVIEQRVLRCRVWRDPTISDAVGAQCAAEISRCLTECARGQSADADRILIDIREAPPAIGPKTEATMRSLFETATSNRVPIAILAGKAMQELQYGRLRTEVGEQWLFVTRSEDRAVAYLDRDAGPG